MTESTNISFIVDVETITVTVPSSGGGGGGGSTVERKVEKKIILDINVPPNESVSSGGDKKVLIRFKNKGDVVLNNIQLGSKTDADNVYLELSDKAITTLGLNEEYEAILSIRSLTDKKAHIGINRYRVTVSADVLLYGHREEVTFFLDVMENDYETRVETLKEINFVADLFEENPECLQFKGILDDARAAYERSDYNRSLSLVDSAIERCKDETTTEEEEVIEKLAPKKKIGIILFFILMIIIIALLGTMFYYYKNKGKGGGGSLDAMFNSLFNETRRLMGKGDIANAQKVYLGAYNIYKRIVSSSLPESVKADCYKKLSVLHSRLVKGRR